MGLIDKLRRRSTPAPLPQWVTWAFPSDDTILGMAPAEMWRTQPHLRTVVTFVARNIAQLGMHTFVRVGETDRRRDREGPMATLLARPNPTTTSYELIYGIVADLALYDTAHLLIQTDADAQSGWSVYRLSPDWVTAVSSDALTVDSYKVQTPGGAGVVDIPASDVLTFHGWHPLDVRRGSSPVSALKEILAEQVQAMRYRKTVWERGGKVSAVIQRPAGAPQWSPEARDRFRADWYAKYAGSGSEVGGTPILEDGMTLARSDFSAHEQEFAEGTKLAFSTVASVYHINPTMVGILDNANYSNVKEFRRMLYGDTLGPTMAMLEDRLNTFLVPRVDPRDGVYVEFNVAEKLQGSFEEQAAAMSTAVGAPYMLRSEARARMNLPSVPGADTLVVPLNVLVGGQASPRDSAPQKSVQVKARAPITHADKARQVLADYFARQRSAVLSRAGAAKARKVAVDDIYDAQRWEDELAHDLFSLNALIATAAGKAAAETIGLTYDVGRTLAWLRANAGGVAKAINVTTRAQVAEALTQPEPLDALKSLYDDVIPARSDEIADTQVTSMSGFGTTEAARQSGRTTTKTWVVTSDNPRPSHAALHGQTVAMEDTFTNGGRWPGDSHLSIDERAGCTCDLSIQVEED